MNLVDAIEKRIADPGRLTDWAATTYRTRLPTATNQELEEAEIKIGSALPPVLALLLREVANGGFGPRDGLLGVGAGGHRYEGAATAAAHYALAVRDRIRDRYGVPAPTDEETAAPTTEGSPSGGE